MAVNLEHREAANRLHGAIKAPEDQLKGFIQQVLTTIKSMAFKSSFGL